MSPDAAPPHRIDPQMFRRVMGRFATGVTVVTYLRDGAPAGMTVNAFLSVSLDPPLVLVSVRARASFVRHIGVGTRCGINILSEQQRNLGPHFAHYPPPAVAVPFQTRAGIPLLEGSLAQIIARVTDIHPAGDHLLFIAAIEHLAPGPEAQPLIFFSGRYKRIHAHDPKLPQWEPPGG
jgi:flavin reductase (DIM6/NTAB) family NADH-FMN oxidoreductase RutF